MVCQRRQSRRGCGAEHTMTLESEASPGHAGKLQLAVTCLESADNRGRGVHRRALSKHPHPGSCTGLWAAHSGSNPARVLWAAQGWSCRSCCLLSAGTAMPRVTLPCFIKLFPNVMPGASGDKGCLCPMLWAPFIICWVKAGFLCPEKQGKPWEFITWNLISREKTEACV